MKIVGALGLGGLWAWHVRETNSQFSILDSFRDSRVHTYDFLKIVSGLWAVQWAW